MDAINRAMSDGARGPRDLYERLDIPSLFEGDLHRRIADRGAREHAAAIARGVPHVLFLIREEDAPRFLYLLLDGTIIDCDATSHAYFKFTLSDMRKVFLPLARAMCTAMLCRGFRPKEIARRTRSILAMAGVNTEHSHILFRECVSRE